MTRGYSKIFDGRALLTAALVMLARLAPACTDEAASTSGVYDVSPGIFYGTGITVLDASGSLVSSSPVKPLGNKPTALHWGNGQYPETGRTVLAWGNLNDGSEAIALGQIAGAEQPGEGRVFHDGQTFVFFWTATKNGTRQLFSSRLACE